MYLINFYQISQGWWDKNNITREKWLDSLKELFVDLRLEGPQNCSNKLSFHNVGICKVEVGIIKGDKRWKSHTHTYICTWKRGDMGE